MADQYTDIKFEIKGQIGIIKVHHPSHSLASTCLPSQKPHLTNTIQFNRPKQLNSFGGNIINNTISALRALNEHPDTVFTVLTGEGRFFSAGADVKGIAQDDVSSTGMGRVW